MMPERSNSRVNSDNHPTPTPTPSVDSGGVTTPRSTPADTASSPSSLSSFKPHPPRTPPPPADAPEGMSGPTTAATSTSPYPSPRVHADAGGGSPPVTPTSEKKRKKKKRSSRKMKKGELSGRLSPDPDHAAVAHQEDKGDGQGDTDATSPRTAPHRHHRKTDSIETSTSLGLAKDRGSRGISAIIDVSSPNPPPSSGSNNASDGGAPSNTAALKPVVESSSGDSSTPVSDLKSGSGGSTPNAKKDKGTKSKKGRIRRSLSRPNIRLSGKKTPRKRLGFLPRVLSNTLESRRNSSRRNSDSNDYEIKESSSPPIMESSSESGGGQTPELTPRSMPSPHSHPILDRESSAPAALSSGGAGVNFESKDSQHMRATSWIAAEEQVAEGGAGAATARSMPASPKQRPEKSGRSRFARHRTQKSTDTSASERSGRKRSFSSGIKFPSRSRSQKAVLNRRSGHDTTPKRTKTGGIPSNGSGSPYASLSSKSLGETGVARGQSAKTGLGGASSPKDSSKPSIFSLFGSRSSSNQTTGGGGAGVGGYSSHSANSSPSGKGSGGFARGLFSRAIVPETHQSSSRLDETWQTTVFEPNDTKAESDSNGGGGRPHSSRHTPLLSPAHPTSPVLYTQMSDRIIDRETPEDSSRESSMLDSDESSVHSTRSTPSAGVTVVAGTTPHSAPAPLNLANATTLSSSQKQLHLSKGAKSSSSSSSSSSGRKPVVASPASAPHTPKTRRGIKPFRRRNKDKQQQQQQQAAEKSHSRSTSSGVASPQSADSGVGVPSSPVSDNSSQNPSSSSARERPTMRDLTSVPPGSRSLYREDSTRMILPEANFEERPRSRRDAYYAEVERELEQQTVLCDFMKKKSRKEVLKTHAWLERFWSLDRFKMTGYKRKDPQAVGVEIPLWKILKVVDHPQSKHDGCRFDIVTGDAQTYSILTKTAETREKWVNFLNEFVPIRANEKLAYYI